MGHTRQTEVAGEPGGEGPGSPWLGACPSYAVASSNIEALNVNAGREPGRLLSQPAHFTDEAQRGDGSCHRSHGGDDAGVLIPSPFVFLALCFLSVRNWVCKQHHDTDGPGPCRVCS